VKIAVPSFYALHESRNAGAGVGGDGGRERPCSPRAGARPGLPRLALGTSISAIFNATVLLALLRRRIGGLDDRRVATSLGRITLASLIMGAAAWGTDAIIASRLPSHAIPTLFVRVAAAIGVGLLVLDIAARMLRVEEFIEARGMLVSRLARLRR